MACGMNYHTPRRTRGSLDLVYYPVKRRVVCTAGLVPEWGFLTAWTVTAPILGLHLLPDAISPVGMGEKSPSIVPVEKPLFTQQRLNVLLGDGDSLNFELPHHGRDLFG